MAGSTLFTLKFPIKTYVPDTSGTVELNPTPETGGDGVLFLDNMSEPMYEGMHNGSATARIWLGGNLAGTVKLKHRVPLGSHAGINVQIGEGITAVTDANGNFTVADLVRGMYMVTFSKPGFLSAKVDHVPIGRGRTTDLTALAIELVPGNIINNSISYEAVFLEDLAGLARAIGSTVGMPGTEGVWPYYNPNADLDGDEQVMGSDLGLLAMYWGTRGFGNPGGPSPGMTYTMPQMVRTTPALTLSVAPMTVQQGEMVQLTATLSLPGVTNPFLAHRPIEFRLGDEVRWAATDANGVASAKLLVGVVASETPYTVTANIYPDNDVLAAQAAAAVTVTAPVVIGPTLLSVSLTDDVGTTVTSVEQGTAVTVIGAYDTQDEDAFFFEYSQINDVNTTVFDEVPTFEGSAIAILNTGALSAGTYTIWVSNPTETLYGSATLVVTAPAPTPYFVGIYVNDRLAPTVPGAVTVYRDGTLVEQSTLTAWSAGFMLVPGNYTYDVTAEGYDPASGSFTVADAAQEVFATMTPTVTPPGSISVHFELVSTGVATTSVVQGEAVWVIGTPDPAVGAPFTFVWELEGGGFSNFGTAVPLDVEDRAVVQLGTTGLQPGTYTIRVTDANDTSGTATLTVTAPEPVTYATNFWVNEGQNPPVTGVVTVSGEGVSFEASIPSANTVYLVNGAYTYNITAEGYDPVSGSLTVSDAPQDVFVTMTPTATPPGSISVHFELVSTGVATTSVVQGDSVWVIGTPDPAVGAPFTFAYQGPSDVEYTSFWSPSQLDGENRAVAQFGTTFVEPGTYTFRVTDANDTSGTATLTVTAPAPPDTVPTILQIPSQSSVVGVAIQFFLAIGADDDNDTLTYSGVLPAGITIDPATGLISGTPTTAEVFAASVSVFDNTPGNPSGDYAHSLFTWTVTEPEPVTYDVFFTVQDGQGIPIANPSVTLIGTGETTGTYSQIADEVGGNVITLIGAPDGTYDYSVTADGFETATGSLTLSANTNLTVVMAPPAPTSYATSFWVNYGQVPSVTGVVTVYSGGTMVEQASLSDGGAGFSLVNGEYTYDVTAEGYDQVTGSFTIADADHNEDVTMTPSAPPAPESVTDFSGFYDDLLDTVRLSWTLSSTTDPNVTYQIVSDQGLNDQGILGWEWERSDNSPVHNTAITYTIYTVLNGVASPGVTTTVDVTEPYQAPPLYGPCDPLNPEYPVSCGMGYLEGAWAVAVEDAYLSSYFRLV